MDELIKLKNPTNGNHQVCISTLDSVFDTDGKNLREILASYNDKLYPVGSIYISVSSTSPASLFGGTWEALKDSFLLGAGDNFSAGSTGGSKEHRHGLDSGVALIDGGWWNTYEMAWKFKSFGYAIAYTTHGYNLSMNPNARENIMTGGAALAGTTDSGGNLPPYLTVYMWKRIE